MSVDGRCDDDLREGFIFRLGQDVNLFWEGGKGLWMAYLGHKKSDHQLWEVSVAEREEE